MGDGNRLGPMAPRPTDVFIAVMGMTGAGKSTFISQCTGKTVEIGHGLGSCTREVELFAFDYSPQTTVYMVDTPGFDDETRPDSEVLRELATWLSASYASSVRLNGIIYIHRITDTRMGGSAKNNLVMFKKLCGSKAFANVVLATTRWEHVEADVGDKREKELIDRPDFWGFMVSRGSKVVRHMNTPESARRLVDIYAAEATKLSPTPLEIQVDMVDKALSLDQTGAGKEVDFSLVRQKEQMEREFTEIKEQLMFALREKDDALVEMTTKHQKEMGEQITRLAQQREDLKVDMDRLHKAQFSKFEASLAKAKNENEKIQQDLQRAEQERARQMETWKREREEEEKKRQQRNAKASKAAEQTVNSTTANNDLSKGKDVIKKSKIRFSSHDDFEKIMDISMNGVHFYFTGPKIDTRRMPVDPPVLSEITGPVYVSFGQNDSWYMHYHVKKKCVTKTSDNFNNYYKDLSKDSMFKKCPAFVELGDEGTYCAKFKYHFGVHTIKWRVTDELHKKLDATVKRNTAGSVRRVWLGKGDSYIADFEGTSLLSNMNLDGNYKGLEKQLRINSSVAVIALNVADPDSYIALWNTGQLAFNTGKDDTFDEPDLKHFMLKNTSEAEWNW